MLPLTGAIEVVNSDTSICLLCRLASLQNFRRLHRLSRCNLCHLMITRQRRRQILPVQHRSNRIEIRRVILVFDHTRLPFDVNLMRLCHTNFLQEWCIWLRETLLHLFFNDQFGIPCHLFSEVLNFIRRRCVQLITLLLRRHQIPIPNFPIISCSQCKSRCFSVKSETLIQIPWNQNTSTSIWWLVRFTQQFESRTRHVEVVVRDVGHFFIGQKLLLKVWSRVQHRPVEHPEVGVAFQRADSLVFEVVFTHEFGHHRYIVLWSYNRPRVIGCTWTDSV